MPAKAQKARPSRATTTKKKASTKTVGGNKLFNRNMIILVVLLAILGAVYLLSTQAATISQASWQRFPGDPNPKVTGKRYWGSSIGGNGDPARHESPTGKSLSVRRTFWGWNNNRTSMISTIKADLAANRLPMVSTKTPLWADVAAGKHDAELDDLLKKVDATGGPVWLTFFHEPEDDTLTPKKNEKCSTDPNHAPCSGTTQDWRNMQQHVRDRMTVLGTKNIALMPILMSWTWDSRSGRAPSDYWVPGAWDALGVDHYHDTTVGTVEGMTSWANYVAFAESKGIPMAIGEWGTRGTDAAAGQRVQSFWNWSAANNKDLLAYSYFDSGLNSATGSWELAGAQLTTFQNILKSDPKVLRVNDIPGITVTTTPSTNTNTGAVPMVITSPANGAVLTGVQSVTAGPDTNVQSVSFRLDGVWQTTDNTTPYAWSWDTRKVANGTHTLTIRARKVGDPGNKYTERSIKVTVKN